MAANTIVVRSTYQDGVAAGLKGTRAAVEAETGGMTTAFNGFASKTGKAMSSVEGALTHAKGFFSGLLSGPLGLIGLGGAAFGAADLFKTAITNVSELGVQVEKLTTLTGLGVEPASALLAVFAKYGISADDTATALKKLDSSAFNLNDTTKKAAAFQAKYGVSLVDSQGHLKDTNTLLGIAANYLNSNASAAQKSSFETALFGKSWQTLIPLLSLGSAGLAAASQNAKDMGQTINDTTEQSLLQFHKSLQDLQQQASSLVLALGIDLVPVLTTLATETDKFVVNNGPAIRQFFKDFVSGVEGLGRFIGGTLIPAFQAVGNVAKTAWNAIPAPLQGLLIQAIIGNKVIKTVFGIDIMGTVEGAVADVGKKFFGNLIGSIFGKQIATPVVNIEAGVVNGVGGVGGAPLVTPVEGAAAEEGLIAKLFKFVPWVAVAAALASDPKLNYGSSQSGTGQDLNKISSTVRDNEVGSAAGYGTRLLAGQKSGNITLGEIFDIGKTIAHQQIEAEAHQSAEAARGRGEVAHQFLLAFRSGDAKVTIADFPKELAYLSTASDEQKKSRTYLQGLQDDEKALKKAMVTATTEQKVKLSADLVKIQALIKDTTAAVETNTGVTRRVAGGKFAAASGIIGHTTGPTNIGGGVMGEAGGETFAILSHPRSIPNGGQAAPAAPTYIPVPVPMDWTPGMQQAWAQKAGPSLAKWMQSMGLLPRLGAVVR